MTGLPIALLLVVLGSSIVMVVIAGTRLARVGDEIAEHTGLGRIFIGALLVAVGDVAA